MKVGIDRVVVRGLTGRPDVRAFADELRHELQRAAGGRVATARSMEVLRVDLPSGSSPAAGIAEALVRTIGGDR